MFKSKLYQTLVENISHLIGFFFLFSLGSILFILISNSLWYTPSGVDSNDRYFTLVKLDNIGIPSRISLNELQKYEQDSSIEGLHGFTTFNSYGKKLYSDRKEITVGVGTNNLLQKIGAKLSHGYFPDENSNPQSIVISHQFWAEVFANDPDIIGKSIEFDREGVFFIKGVLSPKFKGLNRTRIDVWLNLKGFLLFKQKEMNLEADFSDLFTRHRPLFYGFGTMARGAGIEDLQKNLLSYSESSGIIKGESEGLTFGFDFGRSGLLISAIPGLETSPKRLQKVLDIIAIISLSTLLLCFVVLTNFSLGLAASVEKKASDIAVKIMLGMRQWQLFTSQFMETIPTVLVAAIMGFTTSYYLIQEVVQQEPLSNYFSNEVVMNWSIPAFAIVSAFLIGFVATIITTKLALKRANGRTSNRLSSPSSSKSYLILAGIQTIIGTVVIAVSLTSLQAFNTLFDADLGMSPNGLYKVVLQSSADDRSIFDNDYANIALAIGQSPLIDQVSVTTAIPFEPTYGNVQIFSKLDGVKGSVNNSRVDIGVFKQISQSIIAGVIPSKHNANQVVINQSLAKRFFGNAKKSINQSLEVTGTNEISSYTVIAVVGDIHYTDLSEETQPMLYFLNFQHAKKYGSKLLVSSRGNVKDIQQLINSMSKQYNIKLSQLESVESIINAGNKALKNSRQAVLSLLIVVIFLLVIGLSSFCNLLIRRLAQNMALQIALGARKKDLFVLIGNLLFMMLMAAVFIALPIYFLLIDYSPVFIKNNGNSNQMIVFSIFIVLILFLIALLPAVKRIFKFSIWRLLGEH